MVLYQAVNIDYWQMGMLIYEDEKYFIKEARGFCQVESEKSRHLHKGQNRLNEEKERSYGACKYRYDLLMNTCEYELTVAHVDSMIEK